MQALKAFNCGGTVDFAQQLPSFREWFDGAVVLQHIYRTSDVPYCEFLQEVADNKISEPSWMKLCSRVGIPPPPDVKVYAYSNRECKQRCAANLHALPGEQHTFIARQKTDNGANERCGDENIQAAYQRLHQQLHSDGELPLFTCKLKMGVELIANLDVARGLHEGSSWPCSSLVHQSPLRPLC